MIFFKRLKYKFFCKRIAKECANYKRKKYEDRNVLEEIIFPRILADFEPEKILDIGREPYQSFYNDFFEGRDLWTMDIDPERAEFGSENHITDSAHRAADHFNENTFDFVLMNGVIGWGLNKPEKIEQAINGIYKILKSGGIFIIGWNDKEDLLPIRLDKLTALKKFKSYHFKPLKSQEFKCINGEHTYSFFIKK
jgi:SAM-dependent methyltransferase